METYSNNILYEKKLTLPSGVTDIVDIVDSTDQFNNILDQIKFKNANNKELLQNNINLARDIFDNISSTFDPKESDSLRTSYDYVLYILANSATDYKLENMAPIQQLFKLIISNKLSNNDRDNFIKLLSSNAVKNLVSNSTLFSVLAAIINVKAKHNIDTVNFNNTSYSIADDSLLKLIVNSDELNKSNIKVLKDDDLKKLYDAIDEAADKTADSSQGDDINDNIILHGNEQKAATGNAAQKKIVFQRMLNRIDNINTALATDLKNDLGAVDQLADMLSRQKEESNLKYIKNGHNFISVFIDLAEQLKSSLTLKKFANRLNILSQEITNLSKDDLPWLYNESFWTIKDTSDLRYAAYILNKFNTADKLQKQFDSEESFDAGEGTIKPGRFFINNKADKTSKLREVGYSSESKSKDTIYGLIDFWEQNFPNKNAPKESEEIHKEGNEEKQPNNSSIDGAQASSIEDLKNSLRSNVDLDESDLLRIGLLLQGRKGEALRNAILQAIQDQT